MVQAEQLAHEKHAIWSTMQALPGKETEARAFLTESARRLGAEPSTINFYAIDLGEGLFAIINLIRDDAALAAHISGPTAAWVKSQREGLFAEDYAIIKGEIFATKQAIMGVSASAESAE